MAIAGELRTSDHAAVWNAVQAPDDPNQLYAQASEISQLFGLEISEAQLRYIQGLIDAHCNRPTMWVHQYKERLSVNPLSQQNRLSALPVVQVLEAGGRYTTGRKHQRRVFFGRLDFLVASNSIGLPPKFQFIDVSSVEFNPASGQIWFPTSLLLSTFTRS